MLLSKYRVKSFGTVPFIIQLILKFKLYDKFNKDLKYITQAGGKLNLQEKIDFIKICKNKKIKFISMYGTTEASPRVSILPWKYSLKKPDSIGKPITDCEILIFNNLGKRINTANTEGEFVLKGKNIFQGYANSRKDLIKQNNNNKIFKTGNIGKFDEDGFYYITGRINRYIKLFGNRVNWNYF